MPPDMLIKHMPRSTGAPLTVILCDITADGVGNAALAELIAMQPPGHGNRPRSVEQSLKCLPARDAGTQLYGRAVRATGVSAPHACVQLCPGAAMVRAILDGITACTCDGL